MVRRISGWIWDRLANLAWRLEIWNYERRSVAVTVRRSCGHVETTRLLRRSLTERRACYEVTPCAKCHFYEVMAEHRAVRG